MTPVAAQRLAAFRRPHRIAPVKDWHEETRLGYVLRCSACTLRVNELRDGSFRHDASEIAELVRA